MMVCPKCNVTVETGSRCPLCHTPIAGNRESDVAYPDYSPLYADGRRFTAIRLLFFLSIAAGVICTMINILTFNSQSKLWSAIVIVAMLPLWGAFLTIRSKAINTAGKTLLLYLCIVTAVFLIDICGEFQKWSTEYVIPFVTIAVIFYVTLLASVGKKKYREYLGYLIVTLLTSICPLILFIFSFSEVLWTSVTVLVYAVLTAIGLLIFADRDFRTEVRKRFYY
jgi:hypothetical protein